MSILDKMRRWWKKRKRLMALGAILCLFISTAYLLISTADLNDEAHDYPNKGYDLGVKENSDHDNQAREVMAPEPVALLVETRYMCGTQFELKQFEDHQALETWVEENGASMEDVREEDGSLLLVEEEWGELSPVCQEEGHFGLSEDEFLTIYEGPPTDNQVIQTFFRIDTQRLESKLPEHELALLAEGIRIEDVSDFLHVLTTFGKFAAEYPPHYSSSLSPAISSD